MGCASAALGSSIGRIARRTNRRSDQRSAGLSGFSLIELLVVIGIIVLLIGLLVPVISRVRLSAQPASVTSQMHRISAAIGNYFNDFQAYPGALANREFTPSASSPKIFTPANGTYTQSEDLFMALLGGFQPQVSSTKVVLVLMPQEIGLGPASFNTAGVLPRKHSFIDKNPADFTPPYNSALVPIKQVPDLAMPYTTDSEIPEFMDVYTNPRPILYIREIPSATGVVFYSSQAKGSFDPTVHYDVVGMEPYLKGPRDSLTNNDFHDPKDSQNQSSSEGIKGDGHLDLSKQWVIDYFNSKFSSGSGGAKSAYLLIDAGPDRAFGTDDDIVVSAGGGQ
jgi:type II secretory pathway pseudopilin PulG